MWAGLGVQRLGNQVSRLSFEAMKIKFGNIFPALKRRRQCIGHLGDGGVPSVLDDLGDQSAFQINFVNARLSLVFGSRRKINLVPIGMTPAYCRRSGEHLRFHPSVFMIHISPLTSARLETHTICLESVVKTGEVSSVECSVKRLGSVPGSADCK